MVFQKAYKSFKSENEKLKVAIKLSRSENDKLKEAYKSSKSQIKELEAQNKTLEASVLEDEELKDEYKSSRSENEELKAKNKTLEASLAAAEEQITKQDEGSLALELHKTRLMKLDFENALKKASSKINTLKAENAALLTQLEAGDPQSNLDNSALQKRLERVVQKGRILEDERQAIMVSVSGTFASVQSVATENVVRAIGAACEEYVGLKKQLENHDYDKERVRAALSMALSRNVADSDMAPVAEVLSKRHSELREKETVLSRRVAKLEEQIAALEQSAHSSNENLAQLKQEQLRVSCCSFPVRVLYEARYGANTVFVLNSLRIADLRTKSIPATDKGIEGGEHEASKLGAQGFANQCSSAH